MSELATLEDGWLELQYHTYLLFVVYGSEADRTEYWGPFREVCKELEKREAS